MDTKTDRWADDIAYYILSKDGHIIFFSMYGIFKINHASVACTINNSTAYICIYTLINK